MAVRIEPVTTRRQRARFRDLPDHLFGANPAYVPMLDLALKTVLDRGRNPFWRQAKGCEWLALRDGRPVGLIGACRDEAL